MDEVDTVYQKLAEMHSGKFDADRLRMWAHLINMGKHSSFETPPDYPFFFEKRIRMHRNPHLPAVKVHVAVPAAAVQLRHLFLAPAYHQRNDPTLDHNI